MAKSIARKKSQEVQPATEFDSELKAAIGENASRLHQINQITDMLWLPSGLSQKNQLTRIHSAMEMLNGIKPADKIENMLAMQMIGTHHAALECLKRAMLENQTFEGRENNLKHAAKLMSIYKHRGKGQQKVTVEHVHVEAGGQAVVGHVEASADKLRPPNYPATKATEHSPTQTLNTENRSRAPDKRRRKSHVSNDRRS